MGQAKRSGCCPDATWLVSSRTWPESPRWVIVMTEFLKAILTGQFEAALGMMDHCIRACPAALWEGKIANRTFRWVAYHTLFWVDVYLSPGDEDTFVLRDFHRRGGDERDDAANNPGLSKDETLAYVLICRQKLLETLAAETAESLQGPSGFSHRPKRAASCTSITFGTCSIMLDNSALT